jgi:glycosyltransferase involved in cell wall biosynthesis
MIIGIDASRCRSGGARAHLIGIIGNLLAEKYDIIEVHLWTFKQLADVIPKRSWLKVYSPKSLEKNLFNQLWWQATQLTKEAKLVRCEVLFTADASTFCRFDPMVILNQDMLSYESSILQKYSWGQERFRLLVLRYIQNLALKHARGVIFLTIYAAEVVQKSCGKLRNVTCIPHGVDNEFKSINQMTKWPEFNEQPIRCLYISNALLYKNIENVIKAVTSLRKYGVNLILDLVGGGCGKARESVDSQILKSDPEGNFITMHEFLPHKNVPDILAKSHVFIFASSCETFGITLLEAMCAGLPIACSNLSSLPETLMDGGVYFSPDDPDSIADSINSLINNHTKRETLSLRAKQISSKYSWEMCSEKTFSFITQIVRQNV